MLKKRKQRGVGSVQNRHWNSFTGLHDENVFRVYWALR